MPHACCGEEWYEDPKGSIIGPTREVSKDDGQGSLDARIYAKRNTQPVSRNKPLDYPFSELVDEDEEPMSTTHQQPYDVHVVEGAVILQDLGQRRFYLAELRELPGKGALIREMQERKMKIADKAPELGLSPAVLEKYLMK